MLAGFGYTLSQTECFARLIVHMHNQVTGAAAHKLHDGPHEDPLTRAANSTVIFGFHR